jgi:hypothetical protein
LHPTPFKQLEKNLLIQFPGPVLVGISEGGSTWSGDSQMLQFALTASETSGNFSEGMGSAQLAEKHGHKLAPASESPGMPLGSRFSDCFLEIDSRKQL